MATYAIYKCILKPAEECLTQGNSSVHVQSAQRILGDTLRSLPKMYKRYRDGTENPYTTNILRHDQNIFVMRISDPKGVKLVDVSQNPYDVTNFPPCYVIFDNRDGICQMAVERRSDAFNGNPDKVRDLLEEHLHIALAKHKLDIEINVKKRVGEFWDLVNERKLNNDRVKSVKFSFPNQYSAAPIERAEVLEADIVRHMTAVAIATKATKGTLQLESSKNKSLELKQEGDIANMVALCCVNGYDLSVQFEEYGEFKYGEEKRMMQQLDEYIILQYLSEENDASIWHGKKTELEKWLDNVLKYAEEYEDGHNIIKRRKMRNKPTVRG